MVWLHCNHCSLSKETIFHIIVYMYKDGGVDVNALWGTLHVDLLMFQRICGRRNCIFTENNSYIVTKLSLPQQDYLCTELHTAYVQGLCRVHQIELHLQQPERAVKFTKARVFLNQGNAELAQLTPWKRRWCWGRKRWPRGQHTNFRGPTPRGL